MSDFIAFSRAAQNGDLRTLKNMVKEGYQVHKDSGICFTNAIREGHVAVVKFLIEQKIPYSVRNSFKIANLNGQTEVLKYLFKTIGPLNEKHVKDMLMTACANGYLDIVKFLENKIDLHIDDDFALFSASRSNKINIVKYLLSKGLKLDTRHHRVFKASLRSPQDEISQFIIQKHDDIKTINKFLTFSAKAGKLDNVKLLIAKGGDIKIARKFGNQPILDHCTKIFFKDLQEAIPYKAEKEKLIKI